MTQGLVKDHSSPGLSCLRERNNCGGVLSFKVNAETMARTSTSLVEKFKLVSRSGRSDDSAKIQSLHILEANQETHSVGGSKTVVIEGDRAEESQNQARSIIVSVGLENIVSLFDTPTP